jgi:hypothetical protein
LAEAKGGVRPVRSCYEWSVWQLYKGTVGFPELSRFLFDIVLRDAVNVQAEVNKRQAFFATVGLGKQNKIGQMEDGLSRKLFYPLEIFW